MTTRPDMHVGDWGTIFEMTILNRSNNKPLPLAATVIRLFIFQPPNDDPSFVKVAELVTPTGASAGLDGKLKYTFAQGDITVEGQWHIQGLVQSEDGSWHTDIETFDVGENIEYEEAS